MAEGIKPATRRAEPVVYRLYFEEGESGERQADNQGHALAKAIPEITEQIDAAAALVERTLDVLRKSGPNKIKVEMGIQLSTDLKVPMIASVQGKGHVRLTLEWSK
jgi:hypothetical protein